MSKKQGETYWSYGQFFITGDTTPEEAATEPEFDYDTEKEYVLHPYGVSILIDPYLASITFGDYKEEYYCKVELLINEPKIHSDKNKLFEHIFKTPLHVINIYAPDEAGLSDELRVDTPDNLFYTKISTDTVKITVFKRAIQDYVIYIDEL